MTYEQLELPVQWPDREYKCLMRMHGCEWKTSPGIYEGSPTGFMHTNGDGRHSYQYAVIVLNEDGSASARKAIGEGSLKYFPKSRFLDRKIKKWAKQRDIVILEVKRY